MEIKIKTFRSLPCALANFEINGQMANIYEFGNGYDHDEKNAPHYGCGNWKFDAKEPTCEILKKYGIDVAEYKQIAAILQATLNVGRCDLCS